MPELPEVETIRAQLVDRLTGRAIVAAASHPSAKFTDAVEAVETTIRGLGRRGKYLIAALDDGRELIVHLGMTGALRVGSITDTTEDPYVRAWWDLSDGNRLSFRDVRRFGRIAVVPEGRYDRLPTLATLGPDPFDTAFDGAHLWASLRRSSRHLKTQILSQRHVAGVGNIYADEGFWLAGVNPADRHITRARADLLADALRTALRSGLDHGGTTLRDYVDGVGGRGSNQHHLACYGRGGEPCDRCGDLLRRRMIDARSTTWCPTCQPRRA